MNIIIDACSVINLHNAHCLERVSQLAEHDFWIGPIVLGECSGDCAAEVWRLMNEGSIRQILEGELNGERYLDLLAGYGLGPGETECLVASEGLGFAVCTDDGLARRAVEALLGRGRLLGTARLLQWTVMEEIMSCAEANANFEAMKVEGGYLPELDVGFFCRTG